MGGLGSAFDPKLPLASRLIPDPFLPLSERLFLTQCGRLLWKEGPLTEGKCR